MTDYQSLISCWHKLEYFNPVSLPKGDNIYELSNDITTFYNKQIDKDKKTVFTIFFGVTESKYVIDFIKKYFDDSFENQNNKSNKIYFGTIKIDSNGFYINDTLGVSSLFWGLSQLENNKLNSNFWAKEFEDILNSLKNDFEYVFNKIDNGNLTKKPKIVTNQSLNLIQQKIDKALGWNCNHDKEIFLKVDEIHINSKDENISSELLNSFYVKDLEKIAINFNPNESPKAFLDYLNGGLNKSNQRVDVVKDVNELKKVLSPLNIPDGSWPSPSKNMLSLMQQFAVNTIFNDLSDFDSQGLFSVNGPPGTGKTTLLKDIIAPIIVKRAKELVKIKEPADAFNKVGELFISETYSPYIYSPLKEISQGGILVASSNNGAVENISKDLPLKIKDFKISYFSTVAQQLNSDNWGLLSVALGNQDNKKKLTDLIWYNKDTEVTLKHALNIANYENIDWEDTIDKFNAKLHEVKVEKNKLNSYKLEYEEYLILLTEKKHLENKFSEIKASYESLLKTLNNIKAVLIKLNDEKKDFRATYVFIKSNKPGFFSYWFNSKIRKEYNLSLTNSLIELNRIEKDIKSNNENLSITELKLSIAKDDLGKKEKEISTISHKIIILQDKINVAKIELGKNYADNNFWENVNNKTSQESTPWFSEKLKILQSELFILAMKVNEDFIIKANTKSNRINTTLAGFFNYLGGKTNPSKEIVKAMWDTFFLVIPIVSSTFASFQNMFKDVESGTIPWLFIDEAGQAIPQAAAGAIWKSKRVAVVGDPFQIDPVVTIPEIITNNFSKYFNLDNKNIHATFSVQTFADRSNKYGTFLNNSWVGMPLRVHRRCLDPMFKIANKIAYNDSMFNATSSDKTTTQITFKSEFIDCKGNTNGKHFVEEQAILINKILTKEILQLEALPNIYIISPFSEISYKLKEHLRKSLLTTAKQFRIDRETLNDWIKSNVGTVHTFQGKEAECVILCLGLDEKSKNAANWASSKPNILNVALTRAKCKFIAIGDKDIWLKQDFFNQLNKLSQVENGDNVVKELALNI